MQMFQEPVSGLKYYSGPITIVEKIVDPLANKALYIGTPVMLTTGAAGGYVTPRTTASAKPIFGVSTGYTVPGSTALINIDPNTIYEVAVSGATITTASIGKKGYLSTPDDLYPNENRSCSLLVSASLTDTWAANLCVRVVGVSQANNPARTNALQRVFVKILYPENS